MNLKYRVVPAQLLPLVLVLCWIVFARGTAAAEEPCLDHMNPEQESIALDLFRQGKDAMVAGQFEVALGLYEKAYCRYPDPALRHGVSAARLKLGQCVEALDGARFWAQHAQAADQERADQWLRTVQNACVSVVIDVKPADARVWLDEATTPLRPLPWHGVLITGDHVIHAVKTGYIEAKQEVALPHGAGSGPFTINVVLKEVPPPSPMLPPEAPPPVRPTLSVPLLPPLPARANTAHRLSSPLFVSAWPVLGVGVLSAIVGGVLSYTASRCPTKVLTPVGYESAYRCFTTYDNASDAMWGVAGAAAVTGGGLLLGWGASRTEEDRTRVALAISSDGLALVGRF